jgi:hypothetical protein
MSGDIPLLLPSPLPAASSMSYICHPQYACYKCHLTQMLFVVCCSICTPFVQGLRRCTRIFIHVELTRYLLCVFLIVSCAATRSCVIDIFTRSSCRGCNKKKRMT